MIAKQKSFTSHDVLKKSKKNYDLFLQKLNEIDFEFPCSTSFSPFSLPSLSSYTTLIERDSASPSSSFSSSFSSSSFSSFISSFLSSSISSFYLSCFPYFFSKFDLFLKYLFVRLLYSENKIFHERKKEKKEKIEKLNFLKDYFCNEKINEINISLKKLTLAGFCKNENKKLNNERSLKNENNIKLIEIRI